MTGEYDLDAFWLPIIPGLLGYGRPLRIVEAWQDAEITQTA